MAAEIEVVVSLAGEDILAGRFWSHRNRGRESATFSYEESYLGLEGAYELDPRLDLNRLPKTRRCSRFNVGTGPGRLVVRTGWPRPT